MCVKRKKKFNNHTKQKGRAYRYSLSQKKDVIDGIDKGKRTNTVFSIGMGAGIIFGLNKGLRIAGRFIAGLGTCTTLDKRTRFDANYLSDRMRNLSSTAEKESRSFWRTDNKRGVSIAILDKKKGGASRLGSGGEY